MKALTYTIGNLELEEADFDGELDTLQGHIGGWITDASMTRRWACYVDDEGLLKQKPIGFYLRANGHEQALAGNAFFVGIDDEGNSRALTDDEIEEIKSSVLCVINPTSNYIL